MGRGRWEGRGTGRTRRMSGAVSPLCMADTCPNPECATPGAVGNATCGLGVTGACPPGFTSCNKCTALGWGGHHWGPCVCEGGGIWLISDPPAHFYCEPKPALKNQKKKFFKIRLIITVLLSHPFRPLATPPFASSSMFFPLTKNTLTLLLASSVTLNPSY